MKLDILPSKPIKSYCYKTDPYGVLKDKSKIVQFSHFCLLLLQNDNYVAFFFSPLKQYDDDDDDVFLPAVVLQRNSKS